jgi:hypothetical protein
MKAIPNGGRLHRGRDTMCDVMESGRRAFEERYRRIALER